MGQNKDIRREFSRAAEEALYMHRYWEEKYLFFMMTCVNGDSRREALIERAEQSSKYWLDKYNLLVVLKG